MEIDKIITQRSELFKIFQEQGLKICIICGDNIENESDETEYFGFSAHKNCITNHIKNNTSN
jgi:hypothetical protein